MELFLQFVGQQWYWFALLLLLFAVLMWHEAITGPKPVTVQQIARIANQDDSQLIDLRSTKEYREGHIAGAINIPYQDWVKRAPEFAKQTTPLLLMCKYGQQAGSAGRELLKAGRKLDNVYKLQGGMHEWNAESLPVTKGAS